MKPRYIKKCGTIKRQRGGVLINSEPKDAFDNFLSNSTFRFISRGTYGITFKATLMSGIPSPYTRLDYGGEVRHILIKISLLYDDGMTADQQKVFISKFSTNTGSVPGAAPAEAAPAEASYNGISPQSEVVVQITPTAQLTTCIMQNFINEVNVQTDIFLKTMNYLQPICPAIVYSGIIHGNSDEFRSVMDKMIAGSIEVGSRTITRELFVGIKNNKDKYHNLGIIGMEFADDCVLLHSLQAKFTRIQYETVESMALYILLKLAIDTGYTHGDFHTGNIFINTETTTYFAGLRGSPLLIDFGFAQKIPLNRLKIIKDNYLAGNYTDALKQLCLIRRSDDLDMSRYKSFYGYACGTYDSYGRREIREFSSKANINWAIGEFIRKREMAIDEMIQSFEEKHAMDPTIPLLPLSNKIKNSMYSGLIRRGGKRKNKRKTRKRR
jgi:hypothetical protein